MTPQHDASPPLPDPAALYRVLAESAPDPIITIDEASIILSVNPAAERVFEYPAAELVGQLLQRLMPERLRGGHEAGMRRYLATGRRHLHWQGIQVPILTRSGREIPVEISFGEFVADGRRIFSGFLRDVSARVEQERALAEAHARLQEQADALARTNAELRVTAERAEAASRAKSAFLATMSHELRTPLNAILGYADLLALGLPDPVTDGQQQYLGRIDGSGRHLLGLIEGVLDYTRLEAGRVDYTLRPVPLADAVRDALPMVQPQLDAKGLALVVRVPEQPTGPVRAWADRERLRQVLLNLLANAVKFTPAAGAAPGVVTVSLDPAAGAPALTELRVSDTGPGIPADRHEAIFEPFVQASSGLTRVSEGTGLGLAIARELCRGMGGELRVESAPGAGSSFVVVLRRVPDGLGD